ncbi:ABC transporter ATP-binding protein [Actinomyces sp. 2119]|uniref:ABC-F family ATP-binding cassette domain-containing protein n=1 Tax=Actinomyces sp. 2119 TaxID=2321393 RepID=UPI000E6B8654|nr:ABC-F family ATP-binding cassette domain-containing protein [Actinomyces sp. 2119]RJF40301.1 ABC transporter ATP-binding protein [Actinomyces sp. 2119]
MAHLLGAEELEISVGGRRLLESVTLGVDDGTRVGVLGPNGAGKSTLLAVLAGRREPEAGRVTRAGDVELVMLSQADSLAPGTTVRQAVHGSAPDYEWASRPSARDIHAGLLAGLDLDMEVDRLSGGQRRRVALAAVLASQADVVILDEPTNHLDVEGVSWLARHLGNRFAPGGRHRGGLVVVTHDRWFLDAVCTSIWDVVPGSDPVGDRVQVPGHIQTYDGGYGAYVLARAQREQQAAAAAARRRSLLRKELAWLRRGAPARTSKPRFRTEAAEALIADEPPPRDSAQLTAMASARLGRKVVNLESVSLSYPGPGGGHSERGEPDDRNRVLHQVTWRLAPGERVGVVGANGAGKTTLLRLLEGVQQPDQGSVERGKTVQVAVLSQSTHELDALADMTVVEAAASVGERVVVPGSGGSGRELSASQLVERLGFTRRRAWTRVRDLSGGERRRLQLLRLLMAEPNVLLLDEPTNDLDTDTLTAVEDVLDSFPGTLVVVSHDRYLLERVTDHQVALLGDGSLRSLPGGVEQYLELRRQAAGTQDGSRKASRGQAGRPRDGGGRASAPGVGDAGGSGDSETPGKEVLSGARRREMSKRLARVERRLEATAADVERLGARMAELAYDASCGKELAELGRQLTQAEEKRAALEEEWLETAQALEGEE